MIFVVLTLQCVALVLCMHLSVISIVEKMQRLEDTIVTNLTPLITVDREGGNRNVIQNV